MKDGFVLCKFIVCLIAASSALAAPVPSFLPFLDSFPSSTSYLPSSSLSKALPLFTQLPVLVSPSHTSVLPDSAILGIIVASLVALTALCFCLIWLVRFCKRCWYKKDKEDKKRISAFCDAADNPRAFKANLGRMSEAVVPKKQMQNGPPVLDPAFVEEALGRGAISAISEREGVQDAWVPELDRGTRSPHEEGVYEDEVVELSGGGEHLEGGEPSFVGGQVPDGDEVSNGQEAPGVEEVLNGTEVLSSEELFTDAEVPNGDDEKEPDDEESSGRPELRPRERPTGPQETGTAQQHYEATNVEELNLSDDEVLPHYESIPPQYQTLPPTRANSAIFSD